MCVVKDYAAAVTADDVVLRSPTARTVLKKTVAATRVVLAVKTRGQVRCLYLAYNSDG